MTAAARRLVAYVLPVHDEAAGIEAFHGSLVTATNQRPDLDFEFVYVDDGSRDGSLDLLLELRTADERITVISLARNFGHQIAVTAGLDAAAGRDAVIIMDTDLQDPPEVSLKLIESWESGVDVAYAQRRTRKDPAFKRGTAYVFYWLLRRMASVDIPRNVGGLPADGPQGGRGGDPLPRARPFSCAASWRTSGSARRRCRSTATRATPVLVVPAPHHAEAGRRRDPRVLDVPAPVDLPDGHGHLPAPAASARCGSCGCVCSCPRGRCPAGRSSRSVCSMLGGIQLLMMGVIGSYLGRVYVETRTARCTRWP
jgi:dolichol-phosphate mannosyltransferase